MDEPCRVTQDETIVRILEANHKELLDCCSMLSIAFGVVLMMGYRSDEREQSSRFIRESTLLKICRDYSDCKMTDSDS